MSARVDLELALTAHAEIGKALDSLKFAPPEGEHVHVARATEAINALAVALRLQPPDSELAPNERHPYRGSPPRREFAIGDRVRIVGGEHNGRLGTVVKNPWLGQDPFAVNVDAEAGETKPTGGRDYCRGGRGGFMARLIEYTWEPAP